MTIHHFLGESDETKASCIRLNGEYVDSYFYNDLLVNVYSLYGFFVEVIVNVRNSHIVAYVPFERGFYTLKRMPLSIRYPLRDKN